MTRVMHNRIAMFRVDAGRSHRDLAKSVEAKPQTMGILGRGEYKPSLELALAICEVFDVPVERVFSFGPFPSLSQALQKGRP